MDIHRPHTSEILKKTIPPLVIWAVTRLLESDRVIEAVEHVDRRVESRKRRAEASLTRARRNATSQPILLVAGTAALVAGIAMIASATFPKR